MNKDVYKKLLYLVEELEWDKAFDLMEHKGITPEMLYVEIMNDRCKNCKGRVRGCNNCSIYAFVEKYVDNDTLYEMGYLDEDYCFIFD